MLKNTLYGLFLLSLMTLTSFKEANAQSEQTSIRVAVPIIAQLVKRGEDGQWGGPLIDLLKRAEKKLNIPFEIRMVPFKRAVMMVEEGNTDFGIFMESAKRNQIGMPVSKLGDAHFVIVSMKDRPIRSLQDLKDKSVARIRGGAEIKSLKGVPGLKYHLFNKEEEGIRLLTYGRVDALVTADFRLLDAVDQKRVSFNDLAEPVSVEPRELWLYWSWKSQIDFDLVRQLKRMPDLSLNTLDPAKLEQKYREQ